MFGPGLHLLKVFPADLLFTINSMDIANYADENTPYATVNDTDSLIVSLEEDSEFLLIYFDNNLMKSKMPNATFRSFLMEK